MCWSSDKPVAVREWTLWNGSSSILIEAAQAAQAVEALEVAAGNRNNICGICRVIMEAEDIANHYAAVAKHYQVCAMQLIYSIALGFVIF